MRPIFGQPPFKFLARYLVRDEDFIEDAKRILSLDQSEFESLATRLCQADGFLNKADIATLAEEAIANDDDARVVADIVYRLGKLLHDADVPAAKAMDQLADALADIDKGELGEPSARNSIVERFTRLAVDPVGLARQSKARKLAEATTGELDSIQVFCDIRPIFDQVLQRIDGAIPLSTLRIEYSTTEGDSSVTEFHATEKQLDELAETIEAAKRKLQIIKELLASQDIHVPTTKATKPSEVE